MLIDSHCHLTHPRLRNHPDGQLAGVLHRAKLAGLGGLITVGTTLDDIAAALSIAAEHDSVFVAAGFHPSDIDDDSLDATDALAALWDEHAISGGGKVVAAGEMGLDLYWRQDNRAAQQRVLERQLELAAPRKLPIVLHARNAERDTLDILRAHAWKGLRAVFHCFTGEPAIIDDLQQLASDVGGTVTASFTGVVTFKKSDAIRDAARLVGIDSIMVETDAPFLSPEPVRKFKTCEPAFVAHTAAFLDGVLDVEPGTVARRSTANAIRFFDLPIASNAANDADAAGDSTHSADGAAVR